MLRIKRLWFLQKNRADLSSISAEQSGPIFLAHPVYHNCDPTTIWRYHDTFDYDKSDRNYDLRSIRLQYDYDKKFKCLLFARVESRQMEAGACDTS